MESASEPPGNDPKVGGRIRGQPAPEYVDHIVRPTLRDELRHNFDALSINNLAHVVMLEQRKIIDRPTATALLAAVHDIREKGPESLPMDVDREDLYLNYEHAIALRAGSDVGGQIHTGRSRNDISATITATRFRSAMISLIDSALKTRAVFLDTASDHVDTVMPGYTHLQPAQPITLAHYLVGIETALDRDTARLLAALLRANRSPMGAAALAGTGYPIDRELMAELLGFDTVAVNTLDAVASRDYVLEGVAAAVVMGTTLARFAQDLYVWYTDEFALIDFRDGISGTSSIMPQKKNPIVLEHIRGRTVHALGAFTAAVAGVRSTPYTNTVDGNRESLRSTWDALEATRSAVELATLAVQNMIVRADRMLQRCESNFSTVTELADTLVRQWHVSFRAAHEIVGGVVRTCLVRGLRATDIDAELVREVAR